MSNQTERVYVTLAAELLAVINKAITPSGFFKPPKGSHSQLVEALFQQYLEKEFEADILDILTYFKENSGASYNGAKEYFRERKATA